MSQRILGLVGFFGMENGHGIWNFGCQECLLIRFLENGSKRICIQNVLKQGYDLLPLLFNFALKFAIKKVKENEE
jgi:hypothetical protein